MALKPLISFAGGELDPVLQERVTLERYDIGLSTARNVIVGKTGRITSPPGRKLVVKTKTDNKPVRFFALEGVDLFTEWGVGYIRVYNRLGTLVVDITTAITETLISQGLVFTQVEKFKILVHTKNDSAIGVGELVGLCDTTSGTWVTSYTSIFPAIAGPTGYGTTTTTATTGYDVQYRFTSVIDGQESELGNATVSGKIPIASGEMTTLKPQVGSPARVPSEVRVYRRPSNGGVYGYIGATSDVTTIGSTYEYTFKDYGQEADYTNQAPIPASFSADAPSLSGLYNSGRSTVHQNRLVIWGAMLNNDLGFLFSRPGKFNNFYRDFPLSDDSALTVVPTNIEGVRFLRSLDLGLVVFASNGVFLHSGTVSPSNLGFSKKGPWVIQDDLPPLEMSSGVLFVDSIDNVVRQLRWSDELSSYSAEEVSVFSDHLMRGRKITSWCTGPKGAGDITVCFDDGDTAYFTLDQSSKMQAWTRADGGWPVEFVFSTKPSKKYGSSDYTTGVVFYCINKNGVRYIESAVPRYVSYETKVSDTEWERNESIAAMTGMVSYNGLLNGSLTGSDVFTVAAVSAGVWDGPLTLTCGTSAIFTSPGPGAIGTLLRYFNPDDGTEIDLTVTARASNNSITVEPSDTFPSSYASGFNLYQTTTTVSGLSHLNGESVAIISDGYVLASPNNDIEDYPTATVSGGSVTLPGGRKGSIVHVGRPVTSDIETLAVSTVEQRPVLIESQTVNKAYIKVYESRGLYIGSKFSSDDKVDGMSSVDEYIVDYSDENPIIANRYDAPKTRRVEVTMKGDWETNGKVCIRQVDPLHFEILSVTLDVDDQRR